MKITTVLFDLDGTLLPMDQDLFVKDYFGRMVQKIAPLGYDPKALVDGIWAGTAAMVKNDGTVSNAQVFWNRFRQLFGERVLADMPAFDAYYETEFPKVRESCGFAPEAAQILQQVKAQGLRVALATNPIFPAVATENRIRWAGLQPEDFELYTTYENSDCCKPNPLYYQRITEKLGVAPEACLMVGNDALEDLAAAQLGMQVFLLTPCLINKTGVDISTIPHGGYAELMAFLKALN